jgi:uncharacterized membrane protein (GlpM family)
MIAFGLKLLFGTLAFLLIGYMARSDNRRVVGVMLTFPVLNGIGLLTSTDKNPVDMTSAMLPTIMFNGLLCFAYIAIAQWLMSRRRRISIPLLSYGAGALATVLWALIAFYGQPLIEKLLPSNGMLVAIYATAASVLTWALWSRCSSQLSTVAGPRSQNLYGFWIDEKRRWRAVFFILSLLVLLAAAQVSDSAWVGRLSALPLPGFCLIAGLILDDAEGLPAVRDSVFLGPIVAMTFVWFYTMILIQLTGTGALEYWIAGTACMAVGFAICIIAIISTTPRLAARLDKI